MDNKSGCPVTNACSTDKKPGDCGPKKPSCVDTVIKGAFAGGITMFVVFALSWMVLPWHMNAIHAVKNEKVFAKALTDAAPDSGVYVLPYVKDPSAAPAVSAPFAFISVKAGGFDAVKNMNMTMMREFMLCLLIGAMLTCVLKKQGCGCPVATSMKIGLIAGFAHNAPNLIWWHFPIDFSLVSLADDVVSITLAGLVISKLVLSCAKACPGCGCAPGQCKCGGGSCGTKTGSCG